MGIISLIKKERRKGFSESLLRAGLNLEKDMPGEDLRIAMILKEGTLF